MWGTSAKCFSADAACRKSSIMSFADRVRSRLTELIVASDIQNRSQLLTEIKSEQLTIPSTDTSGIELDASVVTHLCRSLTRMLQQPLTVQLDQSLVMDIGRVIFVALPAAHSTRVCEDSDFTPCGTAIQLLAAALFRTYDRKVIGFLLRYLLLNNTPQTVQMATDVWCLICRTSQFLLFGCAGPLIQMEAEFPSGRDARRANLQRIISHLIQFMRTPNTPDSNLISNKYNVPGYHMSDEERQKALTDLTKHILSFEDSFLLHEKTDLIHLYQTIHDPDSDLVAALTAVLKKEKPETAKQTAAAAAEHSDASDSETEVMRVNAAGVPEKEFVVEKILYTKQMSGETMYRVKWKGWAGRYNTWEPLNNLTHCPDVLTAFRQQEPVQKLKSRKLKQRRSKK